MTVERTNFEKALSLHQVKLHLHNVSPSTCNVARVASLLLTMKKKVGYSSLPLFSNLCLLPSIFCSNVANLTSYVSFKSNVAFV